MSFGCHALSEVLFSPLHLAFRVEVGRCQPLVQGQGVTGGVKNDAAIDDAERPVHAQAQALEHRGEVPRIDELAVDRGLAADRVQAGTVQKGRTQGVIGQRLVEPGDRGGGLGEGGAERGGRRHPARWQGVQHASSGSPARCDAPPSSMPSSGYGTSHSESMICT